MICQGCGASYDSEFKFCPHCGRARPESPELLIRIQEPKWEICEIELESRTVILGGERYWFEAVVFGPTGRYTAERTAEWRGYPGRAEVKKYLDPMIELLLAAGWEPLQAGQGGWNYRFRRPASVEAKE